MTIHLGTGVAFPISLDHHGALALARDAEDVEQAIRIVLGTAPGERVMRPEFGCAVHDLVFAAIDALTLGQVEHAVRVALDRWEPRIEVEAVTFDLERVGEGILGVGLRYRLSATNTIRNLVYPFYLMPAEEGP